MAGKTKQRTKGNLKPSNSGSAAALMSKDGTVGFVGFGGLGGAGASNLGYVPMAVSGVGDDADASVDAEFRMVMRKLMKRDAVTKLKAVQEFTYLCKSSSSEAVESALPFWPRLFNKLALDVDYRVREATQQAMEQLVLRVGRNLAPHLRYIIGPWLCAQFDTYAVVASSARKAFQAAFSEEKQVEAILFCRKELFEFLQDNILTQTPLTLSDPKFVEEEEREAKYLRVLSSSILALGKLISVTSNQTNADMEERYLNILKQSKFWKLARHKSPNVRGALFSMVSVTCEQLPSVMSSLSSQASPAVLSALDDSEPAVCQHLWNAVLSVLKNVRDCWKHVNVRKAVLPKLWSVLKNGGSGCATVIFPNLLPFLSKLPCEVKGSGVGFYQEFFSNMQEALAKESVQSSPSESSAVITALMECLRFCLVHGSDGQESDVMVQEYLIKHQLLALMKTSLTRKSKLAHSNLYHLIADLLSYLSVSSDSEVTEQKTPQQYAHILAWFWEDFSDVCIQSLKPPDGEETDVAEMSSVSHCLISLRYPTRKKKQAHKVAFADLESQSTLCNSDTSEDRTHTTHVEGNTLLSSDHTSASNINLERLYNGCLLDLVCDICSLCLEEVTQRSSLTHLKLLAGLVPCFLSVRLIKTLLTRSGEQSCGTSLSSEDSYSALSEQFLKRIVFPWIKSAGEAEQGFPCGELESARVVLDSSSMEHLVDIFCGIVRTLSEVKQVELVSQSLQQDTSVQFLYKVLEKGLHSEVGGVIGWLHSQEASERLLQLSRCLVLHCGGQAALNSTALSEKDRNIVWKLLKLCIVTKRRVIKPDRDLVDKIFQHFLRILRQTEHESEQELLLLLDILHLFLGACEDHPGDIVPSTEDLLLSVFQLQLSQTHPQSSTISETLTATWRTGLKLLSHLPAEIDSTPCQALLLKASEIVQDKLMTIKTLDRVKELATAALTLVKEASLLPPGEPKESSLSQKVFLSLIPSQGELAFLRADYSKTPWLFAPLHGNKLPVITEVQDDLGEWPAAGSALTKHHKAIAFPALLVQQIIAESSEAGLLKGGTLTRESCVQLWLEVSWLRHWCSGVLGCRESEEELVEHCKETDSTILKLLLKLKETSVHLMQFIKQNDWCESLLTEAFTRSRTLGFLWSSVLGGVLDELQKLGVPFEIAVLLADSQALAPVEEKECQTLSSIISHVESIYELKVLTEQYSTLLSEDNDESGFACVFSILGCCLHQWFKQTKQDEGALLEYQLTLIGVLDELLEWNKKNDNFLLLNSSLEDASMSVLTLNSALNRILQMAVLHCSAAMNSKHWDLILCSLAGWLQTCEENSCTFTSSLKCAVLCSQVCSLFCTVAQFFKDNASQLAKDSEKPAPGEAQSEAGSGSLENTLFLSSGVGGFPPNLFSEWQEFFSGTLFSTVLNLFLFHADQTRSARVERSLWVIRISESLSSAVVFTPTAVIKEHKFEESPHESATGASSLSQWIEDLMQHCLPLLMSDLHGLQVAAYHLLSKAMAEITVLDDKETDTNKEEEESIRSPPVPLMELIDTTSRHMTEMVSEADVPFGDYLDMTNDSEAQNVSLALMLAWKLLLQFFRSMPQEKRAEYAKYIKQHKLVNNLLTVLFRLIPLKKVGMVVAEEFEPTIGRFSGQRTVQELACVVYYSLSQWMPAIVRQWWNGLDKRQSAIVDKFTTSYITPQLCQREMQLVQNSSIRFDNMQVKTRPSAREVAAVYTVDEISMELVVKLAANHPLGVVSVESGRKIGVTAAQWRSWMLQMTTFLTHQNGSIMDGLILWKRNVDKRFEGVDDCMICFSVIHGSNYSLPKLSCKTCKKKFHSACLYKWFSTSNNATCPLCRNLF